MTKKTSDKTMNKASDGVMLGIHLDIGHKSIGWAVNEVTTPIVFKGCGTLLFEKDGCLASARRANRRQRRHVRSIRQRIERMKQLLLHLKVLTAEELDRPGGAWPWKLAAEVLAGKRILAWQELWDVLRWYAHNRGYDGNIAWAGSKEENGEDKEERESVENASSLMKEHGTSTMAETVCAVLGVKPEGDKSSSQIRFKGKKASFPRRIVEDELRRILEAHKGKLPKVDDALIRTLLGAPAKDADAWKAVPCPALNLPRRYRGGLLMGQLVPRFDNRIIGKCPIEDKNLPSKKRPEFLEYRWAMQLANIRVLRPDEKEYSPLNAGERKALTNLLRKAGYFTKTTIKNALDSVCTHIDSNVSDMLLHPDAEKALVLYPALAAVTRGDAEKIWPVIPAMKQRLILRLLNKGKELSFGQIRDMLDDKAAFDKILGEFTGKSKAKKKNTDTKSDNPLDKKIKAVFPSGRAPYSSDVMMKAVKTVMEGGDPREEGGVLYAASKPLALSENEVDKRTNNHLVRHRLKILRRLLEDIVRDYANGEKSLIGHVTIEFNREVQEMSGKTSQDIAKEINARLRSHKKAVDYIEEKKLPVTGSLIRKVRIAQELDWTCPYTGKNYDIYALQNGSVDLDHIIPRSDRQSDSLDSLVVTFKAVNAWKSNSTAVEFIEAHEGQPVPGMPNLSILTLQGYKALVQRFQKIPVPHRSEPNERDTDDERRRANRCRRLLQKSTGKKKANRDGFTPGDLTVSSHLVSLAAGVVRDYFQDGDSCPRVISIPGRITKEVRMTHNLLGLLATVNPEVLDAENKLKTKTEIRDITNLHHAVDAVTLGIAANVIPVDGSVWGLMLKRNLRPNERAALEKTNAFIFDADGKPHLRDLDQETLDTIQACLKECRVATHIPANKGGASLEQTIWGIVCQDGDMVTLKQRTRDEKEDKISIKETTENKKKLLGVEPDGESKLQRIKGAIVINQNYGVALNPEPEVIPHHQVWQRIGKIKESNERKLPRILRNGMLIQIPQGRYKGVWKVFSVKNNANGVNLDMGKPDSIKANRVNVLLKTLIKDGMEICEGSYTGVSTHGTPSD